MDKLQKIRACALLTTGRTGTDFLQSLFDSHPQVLTFNGALFFHTFWDKSACTRKGPFSLNEFLDEFIAKHIEKLRSRYDTEERKHQLGENYDRTIDIEPARFKNEVVTLLHGTGINSKDLMLAIYAAYAICLGQDIQKKKLILHHIHHFDKLGRYLSDFPDSKIICMTRDPRANFVSGVENWRRYDSKTDCGAHLYFFIKRILSDSTPLNKYKNDFISIRIEDLGKKEILEKLCAWLDVSYDKALEESTWGGLLWHGDRVSAKKNTEKGWSRGMISNRWEERLSRIDKYVFNYIMYYRLQHYGYSYKEINMLDAFLIPFFLMLPLSYELRFFFFGYIRDALKNKEFKKLINNIRFYLLRICLFFKYYLKTLKKDGFRQPLLSVDAEV